ncbi:MAG: hypothetical protein ACSLFP_00800 [Acidimicrobiales bacterium]
MLGDGDRRRGGELLPASGGGFTARLERWVAEARVEAAAAERSRERWLRAVAEQEATLGGVLLDLAEQHQPVVVTVGGRRHHGVVQALGADFVALRRDDHERVLRLGAVSLVHTAADATPVVGDRVITTDRRLEHLLDELAADRARVVLVTSDDATVTGEVRSIGTDVVVLRTDSQPPGAAYVPLGAVRELALA